MKVRRVGAEEGSSTPVGEERRTEGVQWTYVRLHITDGSAAHRALRQLKREVVQYGIRDVIELRRFRKPAQPRMKKVVSIGGINSTPS